MARNPAARCGGSGIHTGAPGFCRDCMTAEQREQRVKCGFALAATGYHRTAKGHENKVKAGLAVPTEARDRGRMVGRGKTNFNRAMVYRPNHPRASRRGFVHENMVIMEEHLERYLVPGERVVRRDRDHTNPPTIDNLILCASQAEATAVMIELGFCGSPTTIENFLVDVILAEFPEVIGPSKQRFGHYTVDAYLPPPYHLAFEADGDYWHALYEKRDPGHDARRDAYLLREFGLPTVRITESEINALRKENGA